MPGVDRGSRRTPAHGRERLGNGGCMLLLGSSFEPVRKPPAMIPFLDLGAQYRELKPEIDAAVARVLESGQYVGGKEITAFEEEFASYCGARLYGVAVNSGTSALHLALLAA